MNYTFYDYPSQRTFLRFFITVIFLETLFTMAGCVSPKKIVYFQSDIENGANVRMPEAYVPLIKAGDVLSVQVSSLNLEASTFFNPYAPISQSTPRAQQPTNSPGLPEMAGYMVSATGEIELPLIGLLKVEKLTISQTSALIKEKLATYLKEPTVNVRNLNFRISVLGEVMRPSLFTVPNDQITLIEALSLAGDATIYGRRDNILVVREENGQKTFARVDITRRSLFRSPYYYLHPNDIVYVEPGRARVNNADHFYQIVPAILSALSLVAIILSRTY
ncbi:polysaccharide export protein [Spirosoma linguale DSM 74]|uniref:Polysaccharide export protein n=2 Tax=Spirosoma TaxID=107 RepID=D2QH24_SPILD|nr:polysaccharide export protein [Spirosoma linguale DSM 74]